MRNDGKWMVAYFEALMEARHVCLLVSEAVIWYGRGGRQRQLLLF